MQSEPIQYLSLGIEITDKCNAKCDICYQSAGIHNGHVINIDAAFKGFYLAVFRVLRCNPFCKGGYDPVPPPKDKK